MRPWLPDRKGKDDASLLALQRAEEPETIILLQEVAASDLIRGLEDERLRRRYCTVATTTVFAMNCAQPLWADELVFGGSVALAVACVP